MAHTDEPIIDRRRIRTTICVDPYILARIKKIVDAGKRESVSAVFDELALGYLHIIENDCGPEFVQSDRINMRILPALIKAVSVLTDAAALGESAGLAYDQKSVRKKLRELPPAVDPDDEEDEEPAQRPAKNAKKSTKKSKKR